MRNKIYIKIYLKRVHVFNYNTVFRNIPLLLEIYLVRNLSDG